MGSINDLIDHIHGIQGTDPVEIIVVDGGPDQDTTLAITDPYVVKINAASGRGLQMNKGAEMARSPILLFLHADTRLPMSAFGRIHELLKDQRIAGGAFSLGINIECSTGNSATNPTTGSSHRSLEFIAFMTTLRSRITRTPYGDQGIFIRRSVFREIGGFPVIPIMEDLELMRRMRKKGKKIRILHERVLSSPRRWQREGILKCTLRNWYIRTRFLCGTPAEKLVRYYRPEERDPPVE